MAEELKIDIAGALAQQEGRWTGGVLDYGASFVRSAFESIPELVGITPSQETLKFRAANPVSGFVSELAGMAVPYGGWLTGARRIKTLEAVATGLETAQVGTTAGKAAFAARSMEAPFATAARAETVRLLPFEVGRVAASQVIGDQSLGEMAFGAGLNLAFGAGVAGALGKVGAMGKVAPPLREIDDAAPFQFRLRQMDELRANTDPIIADSRFSTTMMDLERKALAEVAPKGTRYVDPRIDKDDELERLFRPGVSHGKHVEKKRPTTGTDLDTFGREEDWQGIFREAGVEPQVASRLMQYPRVLQVSAADEVPLAGALGIDAFPNTLRMATKLEDTLTKRLQPVGDGWLMAREKDNGMFVLAKKVRGELGERVSEQKIRAQVGPKTYKTFGDVEALAAWQAANPDKPVLKTSVFRTKPQLEAKPTTEDAWLLFKTDRPGDFVKTSQQVLNTMEARERWLVGATALERAADTPGIAGDIVRTLKMFPEQKHTDAFLAAKGNVPGLIDRIIPGPMRNNVATQSAKEFLKHAFSPAWAQVKHSPVGSYTLAMGRMMHEAAETWAQKLVRGELRLQGTNALLAKNVPVEGGPRSYMDVIGDFKKEGLLDELMLVQKVGVPVQGLDSFAAAGRITPRTAELAREMRGLMERAHAGLAQSEEIAGKLRKTELRDDDYGLPRLWEGDHLKVVREEGGAIAGIAAGNSAREAAKHADELAAQLSRETGGRLRPAEAFMRNQAREGIPEDVRPFLADPGGKLAGKNIRGFKWDSTKTPTDGELMEAINGRLENLARKLATNVRDTALARHVSKLIDEDFAVAKNVQKRFSQMSGEESTFARAQNKILDVALAPIIGADSASKIVRATNAGQHHLQLGFGKVSYPLQNIVGTMQTVGPELAFVMNGADSLVAQKYGMTMPAVGSQGVVGSITGLNQFKVMYQGLQMILRPSAEERAALEWAVNARVFTSRATEEFVGQKRASLSNWRGALTSGKAFAEFVLELSDWMPAQSEKFARMLSFASGYKVLKDVRGIVDEDLLRLGAKTFTERTNYMYGSADRPLAFTTPLGSSMGLWKTWQMNYIHMMAEYANMTPLTRGWKEGTFAPLLWQTSSTALVGGAAATPLYWLADGMSKLFRDKSLVQYAYDEYKDQADGMMFGLPAALTGISLSGLMTSPGANPVKDATQLFSFAAWTRMKEAGGAVHAAMDNWKATGQHPGTDPDVRNMLIKAFAPVGLARAMSIDEDGTVRNISTQLPSAKGLDSFHDKLLYTLGFNPTILERQSFAARELYESREKMRNATRAFGDALSDAWRTGDTRGADNVLQRAVIMGVSIPSVLSSATARQRNERETAAERLSNPAGLARMQNVIP